MIPITLGDPKSELAKQCEPLDVLPQTVKRTIDFIDDYIYVMDNTNYNDVMRLSKNESNKDKVQLILNELFPGENVDVPDPYYGAAFGFDSVFKMLNESCEVIAKKLIAKHP